MSELHDDDAIDDDLPRLPDAVEDEIHTALVAGDFPLSYQIELRAREQQIREILTAQRQGGSLMSDFEFVIWYEQLGRHYHMTFFISRRGHTRGKSGDLIMNDEEFVAFRRVCELMKFEFVEKAKR